MTTVPPGPQSFQPSDGRPQSGPTLPSLESAGSNSAARNAAPSEGLSPWTVLGCMTLFGLPFLAVGAAALILPRLQGGTGKADPLFVAGAGVTFTAVGLAIIALGIASWWTARCEAALRREHPASPWLWKKEWTTGRIPDDGGTTAVVIMSLAFIWNAMVWPVFVTIVRRDGGKLWVVLVAGALALAGVLLAWVAIRMLQRRIRYGRSIFTLETLPGRIGEALSGSIEMGIEPEPRQNAGCFVVKLSCMRRITIGAGKDRRTVEEPTWEAEQRVPVASSSTVGRGVRFPVSFDIPQGLPPTSDDVDSKIQWRLEAKAEFPPFEHHAEWEVPVF